MQETKSKTKRPGPCDKLKAENEELKAEVSKLKGKLLRAEQFSIAIQRASRQ